MLLLAPNTHIFLKLSFWMRFLAGESNVMVGSHRYNMLKLHIKFGCNICKLQIFLFVIQIKVAYVSNKPPMVGEHISVCLRDGSHYTIWNLM